MNININNNFKKQDTINTRIKSIGDLLANNKLQPIVDYKNNNLETEQFTNPNSYRHIESNSPESPLSHASHISQDNKSSDTRIALNKNMYDFYDIITKIGGRLKYIKSGTTGHTFKGEIKDDNDETISSYAVKVVAYPKKERYGDIHDLSRPENAEIMMIRLLSYFVVKKQTPHITLPMGTFNTDIKPFLTLVEDGIVDKDNKKYIEFVDKYKKEDYYHPVVSILINEWANRGDLLDFIRKYYKEFTPTTWKVIFFQIISVLAVIQSKFPSFRHNDLKANNILIHKLKQRGNTLSYIVNKQSYYVPNIGYQIKIWDFDFACIPGIVDNTKVSSKWTENINVTPEQNRYYDLHYFFNTLIKPGFFNEFMKDSCVPKEAQDFINRIIPTKLQNESKYVSARGRILINKEFYIPDEILKKDEYFKEFREAAKINKLNKVNHNLKTKTEVLVDNVTDNVTDLDKLLYDDYKKNIKNTN